MTDTTREQVDEVLDLVAEFMEETLDALELARSSDQRIDMLDRPDLGILHRGRLGDRG